MQITNIEFKNIYRDGEKQHLKAVLNITLDNQLVIRGAKIIEGLTRIFLAMPARATGKGQFTDIVHPITKEFREELEKTVFEKYNAVIKSVS